MQNKNTDTEICRLEIDFAECIGCAACTSVCHTLALRMDALTLVLDSGLCDNCSLCVRICPTGALLLTCRDGDKND